jgi:hypothetical protein
MAGKPREGLSATHVMSLVMASFASDAGMTNKLLWSDKRCTKRGGTITEESPNKRSISRASNG